LFLMSMTRSVSVGCTFHGGDAVSLWYDGEHPRGRVEGPIPLPAPESGALDVRVRMLTQQIADRLAAGIAAHPQDWHMLQRLWLAEEKPQPAATPAVEGSA
jgi:KDO2-lipid IV(A) lauroyltransferase